MEKFNRRPRLKTAPESGGSRLCPGQFLPRIPDTGSVGRMGGKKLRNAPAPIRSQKETASSLILAPARSAIRVSPVPVSAKG
jgi:hypothetical protein